MRPNLEPGTGHGRAFRRLAALLAAAALLVPGPALMLTPQALAVTACDAFDVSTAGSYTCTVPAGVTSLDYIVVGGTGGSVTNESWPAAGGRGARVSGTLAVTPGEVLSITVGANGTSGYFKPGTGAGYSSISTAVGAPIVIAGGGGGAGAGGSASNGGNGASGPGGGGAGGRTRRTSPSIGSASHHRGVRGGAAAGLREPGYACTSEGRARFAIDGRTGRGGPPIPLGRPRHAPSLLNALSRIAPHGE
jgi:hypothetical protein